VLQLVGELLWSERMLAHERLPQLERRVEREALASAVAEQLERAREHALRLEAVFHALGAEPSSNLDRRLEALGAYHDELTGRLADGRLADVCHALAAAAAVRHELAAYDALLALAPAVGLAAEARAALERSRAEEAAGLERLRRELERISAALPA